ncbi:MAG TPA: hypothetical protein VHA07_14745 [Devosia sp.]|jgi:hypothetical protein|nr:hypothetical protein [Devosia sp.]
MVASVVSSILAGTIGAVATEGQRRPGQWAEIAAEKTIQVADSAPPAIRDQARAFKAALTRLFANYIRMAIAEDRAFLAMALEREGHGEIAQFVRNR